MSWMFLKLLFKESSTSFNRSLSLLTGISNLLTVNVSIVNDTIDMGIGLP